VFVRRCSTLERPFPPWIPHPVVCAKRSLFYSPNMTLTPFPNTGILTSELPSYDEQNSFFPQKLSQFICPGCQRLYFRSFPDVEELHSLLSGEYIFANLWSTPEHPLDTNCALCTFFYSMRIDPKVLSGPHIIRFFRGLEDLWVVPADYQVFFEPGKATCTIRKKDNYQSIPSFSSQVPPYFDPKSPLAWLKECKDSHGEFCQLKPSKKFQKLMLIDCHTLEIVPAGPQCIYAALSYVWASKPTNLTSSSTAAFSPILQDAIQVTKLLGIHYLWIDKFCINQDNSQEKLEQINQMDAIYHGAEITIIAAAGDDETLGLSGCSSPRTLRLQASIGDVIIRAAMADPQKLIKSSKWWTRAWTYQEAVLSRRRLVFTSEQVYFECGQMLHMENLEARPDYQIPIRMRGGVVFPCSKALGSKCASLVSKRSN
jgi:hypothetical protein